MDWIAIITLALTIFTLVVVVFQTIYTKKSLDAAKKSIDISTLSRQIQSLPKVGYILYVDMKLVEGIKKIQTIRNLINKNDLNKLKQIERLDCKGILDKHFYNNMPDRLVTIYESGAQYYYNSSCLFGFIYDKKNGNINNYDDRFKESIFYLEQLRKMIQDEVPDVIMNTPESINIEKFFD